MHPLFLHYPISIPNKQEDGYRYITYTDGRDYFFVIPTGLDESTAYELYTVARMYQELGWYHIVQPLYNVHQQLITTIGKEKYMLGFARKSEIRSSLGTQLAYFHQNGRSYPYEPSTISSYGKWRDLWVHKLDRFEAHYQSLYKQRPVSSYQRQFIDRFPYVIGLAENAIQYLRVTEQETRFDSSDQPTMTFGRFRGQTQSDFIWSDEVVFDHPVRDVAEWIRPWMQQENGLQQAECVTNIQDYMTKQPLSYFGWKLLYARLIFPVHIFDALEKANQTTEEDLQRLFDAQQHYEKHLSYFFHEMGIDRQQMNLITLDWLDSQ
ncbi:hypothetical protein J416_13484 [Gracilibacillus halophilus YIM-C55.5]|uniref:Spore coat protein YutH n=1 Tax=Gracilibacillus halophilus YIM-C55.5 TaxID=1308866 RepID=N4W9K2_9BACI|nr:hypothetical protein [Gracilibacillus halophilus]ENH95939.1 hypothetical protein J416_13484 [Gracilibacillus halophilus YIM-C55.5]